ncbi:hypothetical protein [Desulfofarcimen acetoxidans]|uniref:hypothetical protein n=1 Tax=Desulfofarcimen acetoxidans TaxID=58138 RepID=UPI00019E6305
MDRDPWVLNVQNGSINLRTAELRKHAQEDLITKILSVEFDPNSRAPTWESFLNRIMAGNQNLISRSRKDLTINF